MEHRHTTNPLKVNSNTYNPLSTSVGGAIADPLQVHSQSGSVVFIDAGVEDAQTLIAGVSAGTEAVLLDGNRDGISQISEFLATRSNITDLHIISHATSGAFELGNSQVNLNTLHEYSDRLRWWDDALTEDADILFYGCNLAANPEGKALLTKIGEMTNADVAASVDLTGSNHLGADWDLEFAIGDIEADLPLQNWVKSAYNALLDAVGNNLTVNSASYLGGAGNDSGAAVEIAPDQTIVIAGTVNGSGQILRLDSTGQNQLSAVNIGSDIVDMDINRNNGNITVVSSSGNVTTFNSTADTVLWNDAPVGTGTSRRVAVAQDGTVAVLVSNNNDINNVTVYQADGTRIDDFSVAGKSVDDIAIDSNNSAIFVTGFRQVAANLKLPLFRSYDYSGGINWENYEFSNAEAVGNGSAADSEGFRLAMGRDGNLYFAGKTDGGNNVFRREPDNIGANANNISFDVHSQTSSLSGAPKFAYFARINPATGEHVQGQYFLTRLNNGNGNTFNVRAIAADETGKVYIAGSSAARLPNRDNLQINGTTVGNYTGGEGAVIAVNPNFTSRELVAVWSQGTNVSASPVNGVAAALGIRAMVATNEGGDMITANAIQNSSGGGEDVFFSVWGNAIPNDPPTDISLDNNLINENSNNNTVIGNFTTADPNNPTDSHTYILVNDAGGRFQIVNNQLQVANGTLLDFETTPNHTIRVRSVDAGGLSFEEDFIINLNDINETPTALGISNVVVAENAPDTIIDLNNFFSDVDAGDNLTYSIINNTNAGLVTNSIVGNNLTLSYTANSSGLANITVRATDTGGLFVDSSFTAAVNFVNSQPTDISLDNNQIAENSNNNTVIGNFTTADLDNPSDDHTYTLVNDAGGRFQIVNNQLQVANGTLLDFETIPNHTIRVRSVDLGGLSFEEDFTINLNDINDTPTTIDISNVIVAENAPDTTIDLNNFFSDVDAGDNLTYSIINNSNTGLVTTSIAGNNLTLSYAANSSGLANITVRATDTGGLFVDSSFTAAVNFVNSQPTDISLDSDQIAENSNNNTVIGNFTTTDPNPTDSHTYTLVNDAGGRFQIVNNQLQVANGTLLDFETTPNHTIRVRSVDAGGLSFERDFTINLNDINDTPTTPGINNVTVAENAADTTIDLNNFFTDADAGDNLTYTIINNDNTGLVTTSVAGNNLTLSYTANTTGLANITVRATDSNGSSVDTNFAVGVGATIPNPPNNPTNPVNPVPNTFPGLYHQADLGGTEGIYVVGGTPGETVRLQFDWIARDAKFNNEVGFVILDNNGQIGGFTPGDREFAKTAIASPNRRVLFTSGQGAGTGVDLSLQAGDRILFYLVQNRSAEQWLANNPDNNTQDGSMVLFSGLFNSSFNQTRTQSTNNGTLQIAFEDLFGGGDKDFNDAVFTVNNADFTVPGTNGETRTLEVKLLTRDAKFKNEIGIFAFDDVDGRIGNFLPGDAGYAQAALSRSQTVFTTSDTVGATADLELPSGSLLGWYLIQDSGKLEFLQQNPSNLLDGNPLAFFSNIQANPDGIDRMQRLFDGKWAFEDRGDRDFDDAVLETRFL